MDGVRVQPGFGKRRCRVSIAVLRREPDQQRRCLGATLVPGLALAGREPSVILTGDLGQLSQVLPNQTTALQPSALHQGSPGLLRRRNDTGAEALPDSNPCVLQHILQTPSRCPSDSQRPPPCTYPIRSTGEQSRFVAASRGTGASQLADARL
jgi:hypothetical protein